MYLHSSVIYFSYTKNQNWFRIVKLVHSPLRSEYKTNTRNACKERWTRTRDNHRKALNLRKTKSGQAASKLKPPKYYKELTFLTPYLNDEEERLSNLSPPIGDDSDGDGKELEISRNLNNLDSGTVTESSDTQESQPTSSMLSSRNVGRKSKFVTTQQPTAANVLQEYLSEKNNSTAFRVILWLNFLNMAKTVKTFPIRDQVHIKAQLFQMVNNVEMQLAITSPTPVSNVTMPPPPSNYSRFCTPSTSKQTSNRTMYFSPAMNETLHVHCPSPVTMSPSPDSNVVMTPSPNSNASMSPLTNSSAIMTQSPSTNEFSYTQDQDNQYLSQFLKFPYNNINNVSE
ncbi:uncharacterized protein LOC126555780 isoform X2 [Aphis gossypii]|uniref:uncharacterized protein LOC126555780 isoform X2 n=1 Tax=Aphis gossypii TaxID=80765 RepID=UPI0021599A9E|nr:uncharacterized protein LOC126555780 isoform X2 [Aphis gossypii]